MARPIEEMNDHELLVELVKGQKKGNTLKTILYILGIAAVLVIIFAIGTLLPRLLTTMDELSTTMEGINKLMVNADNALKEADTTLKSIDAIDFESLNQAIQDFAKVIQPLANLFH